MCKDDSTSKNIMSSEVCKYFTGHIHSQCGCTKNDWMKIIMIFWVFINLLFQLKYIREICEKVDWK
jgi:hypothetical protein